MNQKELWKLPDLHFKLKKILYMHQFINYHFFIEKVIPYEMKSHNIIDEHEDDEKKYYYEYKFLFENISFKPATLDNDIDYLTPMTARHRGLSYMGTISADIKQVQYKTDLISMSTEVIVVEEQNDVAIQSLCDLMDYDEFIYLADSPTITMHSLRVNGEYIPADYDYLKSIGLSTRDNAEQTAWEAEQSTPSV
jgi:hypothetical protein